MDRFIIGPKPRTVLSYFLGQSELQTSNVHMEVAEPARLSVNIFCDGACMNNGRRGARASYGVVAYRSGSAGLGEEIYRTAAALSPNPALPQR